ncbi:quinone oxidoreductase family protein [Fodinicola acaciae]|uniref:quinone oxidoreductase family protein n=1 Tax=Fodinicola acaciae TaxID=2681555 RepID=UPI0013D4F40B|nr:zinc-binding dehydrogenase [Fodinicola acaciae]
MRAIVMREPGGPEVLRPAEVPTPTPGDGEVLVRTEAIGATYSETLLRNGTFPFAGTVFGLEAAGTVTAGAEEWIGRRVVVMDPSGGAYAEFMATRTEFASIVPAGLSTVDALAVHGMGATALALVDEAELTGGETVLVESAAGAAGGYLIQLARQRGAGRIIGVVGGEAKAEIAVRRGCDETVDHREDGWQSRLSGLDVVFECIGGESARLLLGAMTPGTGRMLEFGQLSGSWPAIAREDLDARGLRLIDCARRAGWFDRVLAARTPVLELAASGALTPIVDRTLPLAEAAAAHQLLDTHRAAGKIILTP